jgi:glycolate oxidase
MDAELARTLAAIQPPPTVLADEESLRPFETDGFIQHRQLPMAAVLPDSESQVGAVVAACHARGVPVVHARRPEPASRAAPSRTSAGCSFVVTRMRKLLALDPLAAHRDRRARHAQPRRLRGLPAARALLRAGSVEPARVLDRLATSAENAGGVHCLKYGFTTQNVLAATASDGEGERVELGALALDAPGL